MKIPAFWLVEIDWSLARFNGWTFVSSSW